MTSTHVDVKTFEYYVLASIVIYDPNAFILTKC